MVGGEVGFHLPQCVGRRSDETHPYRAIGHIPQFPRIQGCKSLPYLAEDSEGHGLPEYVFSGARNITLSSCLHCTPNPILSTGISGEKKLRTTSLAGWNSSAGATKSRRGASMSSGSPVK